MASENDLEALEDEVGEEISKRELASEMRELNDKVDKLFSVLDEALDHIEDEPSKIDKIIEQNKEMAQGIIALSERVEELQDSAHETGHTPQPQPEPQTSAPAPPGGQDDVPPPPQ